MKNVGNTGSMKDFDYNHGFKWAIRMRVLANLNQESGFRAMMKYDYFTQAEKDYVTFNMDNLDEIAKGGYAQFVEEVAKFIEVYGDVYRKVNSEELKNIAHEEYIEHAEELRELELKLEKDYIGELKSKKPLPLKVSKAVKRSF